MSGVVSFASAKELFYFQHDNRPFSFTESLCGHDHLICANLEEKLHIYAELSVMAGQREAGPDPRLLVRPSTEDIPQAGVLLGAALKEGGRLLRDTHQYIHCHSEVVRSKQWGQKDLK